MAHAMICARNALIEYKHAEDKGWCVVSTGRIDRGSVCAANFPNAVALLPHAISAHCTHCFAKPSAPMKCGRCHYVRYCSASCQKSDWVQHKGECRFLDIIQSTFGDQDAYVTDIRLLLRIQAAKKVDINFSCSIDCNGCISCGREHVENMSIATSATSEDINIAHFVASLLKLDNKDEFIKLLVQFRGNNFGITDELLQCIGAGVFPNAALLNHSCTPNCILRYNITPGQPVMLQVVVVESVSAGAELCHSYVDLVLPTNSRQTKLRNTYGFSCSCNRCLGVQVPERHPGGKYALMTNVAAQFIQLDERLIAYSCSKQQYDKVLADVSVLVRRSLQTEEISEEVNYLQLAEQQLRDVCGTYNLELYKVRGSLLTAYLLQGDFSSALQQCYYVVGFLDTVLGVPYHPLFGLQLFTLGCGDVESSMLVYERAKKVLLVTHGEASDLVIRLNSILSV